MKKINCNKYTDAKLPPCTNLLGNSNPVIKDGKLIFRNLNRLYYFLNIEPKDNIKESQLYVNIQISLSTYLIGLFIEQIESKKIDYKEEEIIHSNKNINNFIHKSIKEPSKIKLLYQTNLILVYSNGNAILTPIQYNINISLNNFLILLTLNRIENNPALLFVNNADATEDILNFILSEIDVSYKQC